MRKTPPPRRTIDGQGAAVRLVRSGEWAALLALLLLLAAFAIWGAGGEIGEEIVAPAYLAQAEAASPGSPPPPPRALLLLPFREASRLRIGLPLRLRPLGAGAANLPVLRAVIEDIRPAGPDAGFARIGQPPLAPSPAAAAPALLVEARPLPEEVPAARDALRRGVRLFRGTLLLARRRPLMHLLGFSSPEPSP